ncbi:biotin-dependent carboxyltransferase family protein [Paenibacillus sp. N3.4]|uniref:5-oxoprolinase subunit C family protein n=1 Tax=Paenibacillus sp. N3.4 TaxID=2603222 RepID=UPI0011C96943|nr:biotin-dependent carboxyltransferase family protein [Paenibacillus sp. N3.4]TXK85512.1 biotin-dependent carboxyltransferase [Paenibacillus sp. N3.4]
MGFKVINPGLLTTLQDMGRYGQRKYGVVTSGPMDLFAHRVANILVGNPADKATLEMTLQGPVLHAHKDMLLALCGADMEANVDGVFVPLWSPFVIHEGSKLHIHYARHGCRAYLAVGGGFDSSPVMGSRSTYLRARIGGYEGRALQEGDVLPVGAAGQSSSRLYHATAHWGHSGKKGLLHTPPIVSTRMSPVYEENPVVRVLLGREAASFTEQSRHDFQSQPYLVTPQSDRMGYRMEGKKLVIEEGISSEMISEAVVQGTIQVPPSGQPILLMADCQTTGGYPRIAHVISVDLPLVAQVKPGGQLRFREVSHAEAQEQIVLRELDLRLLEVGLKAWAQDQR